MLQVDDEGFVRAPAPLVYRRLTDIGRWPTWWPGSRVTAMADAAGRETWAVQLRPVRRRALRLAVHPHAFRHDVGFHLDLSGEVTGDAEFWLERVTGGTVVHHLMQGEAAGAPGPALRSYRAAVRQGLWGFKDAIQAEVRTALGLQP